ncbi:hypothetical protein B1F77_16270 [Pseudomonas syringae]|uniref:FAD/FMN-containing dehydrogenase n=1 Tax=Pseudomonas syringae TaxID=317 RepID=A0AB37ZUP3_PSESX|nr:hypothetical protein [Pseudomonas syringae]MBI6669655.1 hypothetical protein [Pseudomonas syringae]MBI6679666.1 hypothetical protein [Pseudomonas syringae]MBI6839632.1 hypothetical protein [Pseudomonas syringae]NAP22217.1 hypothetical protein [Pseudomonas syringae]NAQ17826.1 hypothetical protein [Pseudomonas syringae]
MRRLVLLTGVLLCFSALADNAIQPVKKWTLLDQNDQAYTLDDDAQVLLVARSMSAAKLMNAAVEDSPAGYLEARHIIYVADIEKMPSLIKLVAVPAMRSAKYRILLDRDGRVAGAYNGDRESVQWLTLKNGAVLQEKRFNDGAALKQAIAEQARP